MPTPEPPKIDTGAAVDAAAEQAQQQTTQRRRAIARNRTVFTNPLGIAGEAQTVRKALLGQ